MANSNVKRRDFMKLGAAAAVSTSLPAPAASMRNIRRIGVEEAFVTPAIAKAWEDVINTPGLEPGYKRLGKLVHVSPGGRRIVKKLQELGEPRLKDMETTGVDFQVISIASPGVQVFKPDLGTSLAREANDYLHDAVQQHPDKYAGLATIAPQAPEAAAKELERCINKLDFRGALINSHTNGEFLDNEKFYPLLEVANELKVPIYLHPRTPPPKMLEPFLDYDLFFAHWGFAAEASLHAVKLIFSGLFERFPDLKFILGHMGEGIPFWLQRMDGRFEMAKGLGTATKMKKPPSAYFNDNFVITISGVTSAPALRLALDTIGVERIFYAVDYPFEFGDEAQAFLDTVNITEPERHAICHGNAERLFRV
jgi:5-carboxyvanillate decarboxylase